MEPLDCGGAKGAEPSSPGARAVASETPQLSPTSMPMLRVPSPPSILQLEVAGGPSLRASIIAVVPFRFGSTVPDGSAVPGGPKNTTWLLPVRIASARAISIRTAASRAQALTRWSRSDRPIEGATTRARIPMTPSTVRSSTSENPAERGLRVDLPIPGGAARWRGLRAR